MLMANSAASFTLCRTKNVPSERLVRMPSAAARSMGPAYLSRYTKEKGPHSPYVALLRLLFPPTPVISF